MPDSIDDLNRQLQEATDEAEAVMAQQSPSLPPEAAPDNVPASDFDPALLASEEPADLEETPAERKAGLKVMAKNLAAGLSSLMGFVARKIYPRNILQRGDAETMQQIEARVDMAQPGQRDSVFNSLINEDEENLSAYGRYVRLQAALKEAPFSKEEQKMLADAIVPVMEQYKLSPSPTSNLVFVVFMLMLPRLEHLVPGLGAAFSKLKPE